MKLKIKLFILALVILIPLSKVLALDLAKLKGSYIAGDYKAAIKEGEKIMAVSSHNQAGLDELYYILGLSYLKDGNYLRASDIFEIVINEFKSSNFVNEAKMGMADVYYFKGEYASAENKYKDLLNVKSTENLKAQLYYRLSEVAVKLGKSDEVRTYQEKLKKESPLNMEPKLIEPVAIAKSSPVVVETAPVVASAPENQASVILYSVQVGSFTSNENARNLSAELNKKSYAAFVDEVKSDDRLVYKVKVGKFSSRQEAVDLEAKLAKEGYPTKIYP